MSPMQRTHDDEQLLTSAEAADLMQVSEQTLRTWRCTKRFVIPTVKLGSCVRYKRADLLSWIDSRRQEG